MDSICRLSPTMATDINAGLHIFKKGKSLFYDMHTEMIFFDLFC